MAKFKSYAGKQVMLSNSILTFVDEVVETEDKDAIEALSKAQGVELVKEKEQKVA